jgi:hypothetical protein
MHRTHSVEGLIMSVFIQMRCEMVVSCVTHYSSSSWKLQAEIIEESTLTATSVAHQNYITSAKWITSSNNLPII